MPKYTNREIIINDTEEYEDLVATRTKAGELEHYRTMVFNTDFKYSEYNYQNHIWSKGDKLYKLSAKYYGNTKYWWLIALWNGKPTDAHYKYGQKIQIPYPIEELFREVTDGTMD